MEFKQTIRWEYLTTIPAHILTTAVFFEMLCFHFDPAISQYTTHTVLLADNTIPHFLQQFLHVRGFSDIHDSFTLGKFLDIAA
jgi:hypothetical protein